MQILNADTILFFKKKPSSDNLTIKICRDFVGRLLCKTQCQNLPLATQLYWYNIMPFSALWEESSTDPYIFPSFPFVSNAPSCCSRYNLLTWILHILFRSVSPLHCQWPAPMGSWRVFHVLELILKPPILAISAQISYNCTWLING